MDTNTPLTLIPPKARLTIYLVIFLASLAFTAVGAYYIAIGAPVPDWAVGGAAAMVPLTAVFSAVAATNTTRATTPTTAVVQAPADVELSVKNPDAKVEKQGYGDGVVAPR